MGTDEKDYYVEMEYEIIKVYEWKTVEQVMKSNNPKGYEDGEVIQDPYTGYDVKTYKCKYDKQTGELLSRTYEATSNYEKRDKLVCKIEDPAPTETTPPPTDPPVTDPPVTDPTETDPTGDTTPAETDPQPGDGGDDTP